MKYKVKFFGNLEELHQYFTIIDNLQIVDTSATTRIILLTMANGKVETSVSYDELPEWFTEGLPNLAEMIRLS